jgi:FkbM family methyltransferase
MLPFVLDTAKWEDGRGTYQRVKRERALEYVRVWRTAIDVGAHVGLWAMHLAKRFAHVACFEPVAEHRACFAKNLAGVQNTTLFPHAVGARTCVVDMAVPRGSSGGTTVATEAGSEVSMVRMDDYAWDAVDFLKIDCEGYELHVLHGAEEMLKRCRPCVIVEQKPGRAQRFGLKETEAVDYLRGLGAHLRTAISGDFILSWDA